MTSSEKQFTSTLYEHVSRRASDLAAGSARNTGYAASALARLRRAASADPGEDPTAWSVVFHDYPGPQDDRDFPSATEQAAFTALALFALHQQSRSESMHHDGGLSVGAALGRLARQSGDGSPSSPVVRRFNALVTADSPSEARWHLRSLVGQLRAHGIALDYGRLADDLAVIYGYHRRSESNDQARRRVQLRWSRDFSRTPAPDATVETSPQSPTTQI